MAQPLINGQRHSWAKVEVNLLDRILTGITSVSYDDSVTKENHYGAGNMPVHRGVGKYEANASVTWYNYEGDAIQAALGNGQRLQDIPPFDVTVSFLDDATNQVVTHVIRNCEFKSNKRSLNQGDTKFEVSHDLICSHIEWS